MILSLLLACTKMAPPTGDVTTDSVNSGFDIDGNGVYDGDQCYAIGEGGTFITGSLTTPANDVPGQAIGLFGDVISSGGTPGTETGWQVAILPLGELLDPNTGELIGYGNNLGVDFIGRFAIGSMYEDGSILAWGQQDICRGKTSYADEEYILTLREDRVDEDGDTYEAIIDDFCLQIDSDGIPRTADGDCAAMYRPPT